MKRISRLVLTVVLVISASPCLAQRIHPDDLEYQGTFRLPEGSGGSSWEYSGSAATYYPDGDPDGPEDGYPGSIFALGHDHQQYVSEISIPTPVISMTRSVDELNTARTLQPFHDITGGMFGDLEIPQAGLQHLPPQGSQSTDKLHFCWGQHFQDFEASHGWCELKLSAPSPAGPWHFGPYTNYVTNSYLFEIPESWAALHTPGQRLASGRFREGVWGGQGPTLFAFAPWEDGGPPAPNDTLRTITPLLLYGIQEPGAIELTNSDEMEMDTYAAGDDWSGGAWLTGGDRSAVVFVGTKATGANWYGFADGTVWPMEGPYPEVPPWPHDNRGYWSEGIEAQILFYDPADLAAVAAGTIQPYEPQPYAALDITPYLFDPEQSLERYKRHLLGATCFDRAHGLLYVFERLADEDRSLIHVWHIRDRSADAPKPVDDSGEEIQGLFGSDNTVGIDDFLLFAGMFGKSSEDAGFEEKYDLDENGSVGLGDFLLFTANFGKVAVNY